jgi:hypothetical protein
VRAIGAETGPGRAGAGVATISKRHAIFTISMRLDAHPGTRPATTAKSKSLFLCFKK